MESSDPAEIVSFNGTVIANRAGRHAKENQLLMVCVPKAGKFLNPGCTLLSRAQQKQVLSGESVRLMRPVQGCNAHQRNHAVFVTWKIFSAMYGLFTLEERRHAFSYALQKFSIKAESWDYDKPTAQSHNWHVRALEHAQ